MIFWLLACGEKEPAVKEEVVAEPSDEDTEDTAVTAAYCGDGEINQAEEECDDGAENADDTPNACREDCTLPICGDGVHDDDTEACDDGNYWDQDGCSASCQIEEGAFEQEPNSTVDLAEDRGRASSFRGSLPEYDVDCFRMPFVQNDYASFSIRGELILNEDGEEEEVCEDYFHLMIYQADELVDSIYQEDSSCLSASYEEYPTMGFVSEMVDTVVCIEGVFGTAIAAYQVEYQLSPNGK